jgi:hypothetical protein
MKINTHRTVDDNIPAIDTAQYHINPAATVHIARLLRNIYKDPVHAVVREYLANAIDAHTRAGQTIPIEVHRPTIQAPIFRVRDYGAGLNVHDVKDLLLGFGTSDEFKRVSEDEIGGFGIGCKCAFAVSDAFTYMSWHGGAKQTWLCQLDSKDMGEAKLISQEPSDEPSGLQIEIPAAASQLKLFESHIQKVPMFASTPIAVDGKEVPQSDRYEVYMAGKLGQSFPGAEWFFYKLANEFTLPTSTVVIMGDMWYPLDLSYLKLESTSRFKRILNHSGMRCAFKVPIGALTLAPTRESLQYDDYTRERLRKIVTALETDLQLQSQALIDAEPTMWDGGIKAVALQHKAMYDLVSVTSLRTVNGKSVPKQSQGFVWNDTTYGFITDLSIPAGPHPSGVKLVLAARDTRIHKSKARYIWRRPTHSNDHKYKDNYAPTKAQLRTYHIQLTNDTVIPGDGCGTDAESTCIPTTSIKYVNGYQNLPLGETDNPPPMVGIVDTSGQIERYVCMRPVKVCSLQPRVSAEYYTRKYLIGNECFTPHNSGHILVVQGTDDQRAAFFKTHPWLDNDVNELPLTKTAVSIATSDKRRRKTDIFTFNAKELKTDKPSTGWDPVLDVPDGEKVYVDVERCIPLHSAQSTWSNLYRDGAFNWLITMANLTNTLVGKQVPIYGLRCNTARPVVLSDKIHLEVKAKDAIQNWYMAGTLAKYPIHSFQLLLMYGPSTLFNKLGIDDNAFPLKLAHTTTYLRVRLFELLVRPEIREAIHARSGFKSPIRTLVRILESKLDLKNVSLSKYVQLLDTVIDAQTHLAADAQKHIIRMPRRQCQAFTRFAEPVLQAMDAAWAAYPMLQYLDVIPSNLPTAIPMLDYIHMVDNYRS